MTVRSPLSLPSPSTATPAQTGLLQRKCAACESEDKLLQRRAANQNGTSGIPPIVHEVLNSPGQSLDPAARAFMEPRFGHDFSHVRVHTDAKAIASAQAVNALAYTVGPNIVFNQGQYSPQTISGQQLLAHELTHVLQQKPHHRPQAKLSISQPAEGAEHEADRTADAVVFGQGLVPQTFTTPTSGIQRACGAAIGTPTCPQQAATFVFGHPLFRFNIECDDFAPREAANLIRTARALPSTTTIEIHGFASTDGNPTFNQNLACARALKAQSVLTSPHPTGAGIDPSRIRGVFSHGPTPGPAAERRSVVLQTSTVAPPPARVTVAFSRVQAATSPSGMPDRIPPRVDTAVGVGILGWTPPMLPITISLEGAGGGNGTATIDGAATADLSSTMTVNLRGVDQTAVGSGGNLRLVAHQGTTRLAASNRFSVASIPQNWGIAFHSLVTRCPPPMTGRCLGFNVQDSWESDSGDVADLDQVDIAERIEFDSRGGSLATLGIRTSHYLSGADTFTRDTHSVRALSDSGFWLVKQTSMFRDNRTGAADIPVRNSGYRIGHFILPVPGTGTLGFFSDYEITTMKYGAATTALGISSGPGSGTVTKVQRV